MDLAAENEAFLMAERRWVSAAELCERFGVNDRAFRQNKGRPGLVSYFAVSGDQGYRHIAWATDEEFEHWSKRLRRHAIGELVRIRRAGRERRELIAARMPPVMTRDGQGLLFV